MQPLDAERVKEWRHRRMLSQQEVADRAGTSLFTIQRIERGEGNVRPKTGRGVAAALGIPIEELLPKAQAPTSPTQPPLNGFEEERREIPGIEVVDTFFVPPDEGEEEDKVILKFYYVRLLEGDEPILKVMREVSPDEEAMIRRQLEKSGRHRE